MQAVRLKRFSAETEQLANKDVKCSEISHVVENLQEQYKKDAEEMKVSLQTVEDQIRMLKSEHESLVKIGKRNTHKQWLKKEKKARSGEDHALQDIIADTNEPVVELCSEKIIGLKKIDGFTHDKEVINVKQEVGKKQLDTELGEKQEELKSFKRETKIQRKQLKENIHHLTCELFEYKVKFYSVNICMLIDITTLHSGTSKSNER